MTPRKPLFEKGKALPLDLLKSFSDHSDKKTPLLG
jgi:hypothetical protein